MRMTFTSATAEATGNERFVCTIFAHRMIEIKFSMRHASSWICLVPSLTEILDGARFYDYCFVTSII